MDVAQWVLARSISLNVSIAKTVGSIGVCTTLIQDDVRALGTPI